MNIDSFGIVFPIYSLFQVINKPINLAIIDFLSIYTNLLFKLFNYKIDNMTIIHLYSCKYSSLFNNLIEFVLS